MVRVKSYLAPSFFFLSEDKLARKRYVLSKLKHEIDVADRLSWSEFV